MLMQPRFSKEPVVHNVSMELDNAHSAKALLLEVLGWVGSMDSTTLLLSPFAFLLLINFIL